MSDRDVLLEMFRRRLQPDVLDQLTLEDRERYYTQVFQDQPERLQPQLARLQVESLTLEVHDGYSGFVAEFSFDDEGNLTRVAAWE